MCKIVCNVTYSCGHTEPWVTPRSCQFDAEGNRKRTEEDPMCLIPGHCWAFGSVRQINIVDELLCSTCFIAKTEGRRDISAKARENMISKATREAKFHSRCAKSHIKEAEERSQLRDISVSRIDRATGGALKRLDLAFSDAQMEHWHFAELLQIVIGLPFLNKERLVGKFASEAEKKFDVGDVRDLYELSTKYRKFGDYFRKGLKNPSVLDEPQETKKSAGLSEE
ncbi:hypothetical protein F5Y12DRAFT_595382 [Xylaria sp. FL1777]|nr:hypothetical protein F5Y12DRAFT_595382 [Xylaria sp. FL1777]